MIPYRKPRDGGPLPAWQEDLNRVHRSVRARIEHALARMKCWKILRDHRRKASTLLDFLPSLKGGDSNRRRLGFLLHCQSPAREDSR